MTNKISAVFNTLNEEGNIRRAVNSVNWVDEIIVCDMHSDDKTAQFARELGAKVFSHKRMGYVEPARNFAISKATGNWILILDADEEIPQHLAKRLKEIVEKMEEINFVEIPRRNIIFGKGLSATGWWPDYHIRFFRKDSVVWHNEIHSKPQTKGEGIKLEAEDKWAIIHKNYQSVGKYINRMNNYTNIQAEEIRKSGYKFKWQDLFEKPINEFLSRYFAHEGFKDGLHGLSLSLLQAFSHLVLYLKIWEMEGFQKEHLEVSEFELESRKIGESIKYWINEKNNFSILRKIFKKIKL